MAYDDSATSWRQGMADQSKITRHARMLPSSLEGLIVGTPVGGLALGREGFAHANILSDML